MVVQPDWRETMADIPICLQRKATRKNVVVLSGDGAHELARALLPALRGSTKVKGAGAVGVQWLMGA